MSLYNKEGAADRDKGDTTQTTFLANKYRPAEVIADINSSQARASLSKGHKAVGLVGEAEQRPLFGWMLVHGGC